MKILFNSVIVFLLITQPVSAQTPAYDWHRSWGGTGSDNVSEIFIESNGDFITAGAFQGTADLNPGGLIDNHTSSGGSDCYVQRLDMYGNYMWAVSFGGSGTDKIVSIDVDDAGNILVAGYFENSIDLDPGPLTNTHTSAGDRDMFVQKFDPNGNLLFAFSLGGPGYDDMNDIAVDAQGNFTVVGSYSDSIDFDPGAGSAMKYAGTAEAFVVQYSSTGTLNWTYATEGASASKAQGISIDANDDMIVSGYITGMVDFDQSAATNFLTSIAGTDIFVMKLTSNGSYQWLKGIHGTGNDWLTDMALDQSENILLTGYLTGTTDYDPHPVNTDNHSTNGQFDIFTCKLSPSGDHRWAMVMGGTNWDVGSSITADNEGNVFTSGYYKGSADFDPTAGTWWLTASSTFGRAFIHKVDSAGTFEWAGNIGSMTASSQGYIINADAFGNVYVGGFFSGTSDMDPGALTVNANSVGAGDACLLKLRQCTGTSSTINETSCSAYTSPSGNYTWTNSGTYMDVIPNSNGCDSVMTINLTITGGGSSTISEMACGSYTSPSGNYSWNSSGTYMDTVQTAQGCDSVITINLTIGNESPASITALECESYTSPSGLYTWSSSGTYMDTIPTALGCDSVITIVLTIHQVDVAVSSNGANVLTANASGASYQWVDCDNGYAAIPGETGQNFTAQNDGNYAVIINDGICVDTSACQTVIGNAIEMIGGPMQVSVYPNPASTTVTIDLQDQSAISYIELIDLTGRVWLSEATTENTLVLYLSGIPSGYYFVRLRSEKQESLTRLIIQ